MYRPCHVSSISSNKPIESVERMISSKSTMFTFVAIVAASIFNPSRANATKARALFLFWRCAATTSANAISPVLDAEEAKERKLPTPALLFVGRETMPVPLLLLLLQKICSCRDDDLLLLLLLLLLMLLRLTLPPKPPPPRVDDGGDDCVRMNRAMCRETLLIR